ncbi:MAG: transaldolase [Microthrixaceae bacterium]|nr:transaldolase [Microthrixaceae bacterium]
MSNLHRLFEEQGQSPWLDNIRREWLHSGEMLGWIEKGVRGVTANPSIFQKAIADNDAYDAQLRELKDSGASIEDIYWTLVVTDIIDALDLFGDLYRNSGGGDGYVSVEVSPLLANDTSGTVAQARELWDRIQRPNLFVKIPATAEGIPAIRQMIGEGRNINVTLIFSLDRYEEVMEAYIAGLEDALAAGTEDLSKIASVASFFISRVDTEIDRRLDATGSDVDALKGKAAVAQGQIAYELFTKKFSGERWDALVAKGAKVQRPLWASTSTKNPAYPDTLYVDTLIGPDTVNTLPEATIDAFSDHGVVGRTIDSDITGAHKYWDEIGELVDLPDVAVVLENEGVSAFNKAFHELIESLTDKAQRL